MGGETLEFLVFTLPLFLFSSNLVIGVESDGKSDGRDIYELLFDFSCFLALVLLWLPTTVALEDCGLLLVSSSRSALLNM